MACKRQKDGDDRPWFLRSSYPVSLPHHDALTMSQPDFERFLVSSLASTTSSASSTVDLDKGLTAITPLDPVTPFVKDSLDPEKGEWMASVQRGASRSSVIAWDALSDIAHLDDDFIRPDIGELLERAWAYDPHVTLVAIFNIRSIHMGRESKYSFYNAAGWLAQNHPLTLIANLQWLIRPVIKEEWMKTPRLLKSQRRTMLETQQGPEKDGFDVENGLSHGYWKDLLNVLVLAALGKLDSMSDTMEALNKQVNRIKVQAITKRHKKRNMAAFDKDKFYKKWHKKQRIVSNGRNFGLETALEQEQQEDRPEQEQSGDGPAAMFESNALYRALHLAVARMFAQQLKSDLEALRGSDARAKDKISLCGKWAPSHKRFHDRHTLIATSIAEILHPRESLVSLLPAAGGDGDGGAAQDREIYLRHAREEYRKDVSALRKHLDVVERKITINDYASIEYDQLDVHVLKRYKELFVEHDRDGFVEFLDSRAAPTARSFKGNAPLSIMTMDARRSNNPFGYPLAGSPLKGCITHRVDIMETKAMDARWRAFVERVKHSDKTEMFKSSVAVLGCSDWKQYIHENAEDDTKPEDTQIGFALLMAELTSAPFGNSYITFHPAPEVVKIEPEKKWDMSDVNPPTNWMKTIFARVKCIQRAAYPLSNTNFVKLFDKVILPMAIANNVPREDMIKRVWVFCDQDFASAESSTYDLVPANKRWGIKTRWSRSYERINKAYDDAGYQMPELIFWNLLGDVQKNNDTRALDAAGEPGVRLVFGYSQALLRRLLQRGTFDPPGDDEEEEDEEEEEAPKEERWRGTTRTKRALWSNMRDIIGGIMHQGFAMLQVFD